jgi:signal transduction histidine kinase
MPPARQAKASRPPANTPSGTSSGGGLPRLYRSESIEPSDLTETFVAPDSVRGLGSAAEHRTLTVLSGGDADLVHRLGSRTTWIGRDQTCDVCLQDRGVSRRHASFTINGADVIIRDNDARNGTYVNGKRIKEYRLRPGDEIQIGPYVGLLFSTGVGAEQRLAQQQATRDELLSEQMYAERIESLANLVTSLAHELNTPLGVATTAHGMISMLTKEMQHLDGGPQLAALLGELKASTDLIGRNLARANELVRSFKQLSARQLSDEYMESDLISIVEDCFAALALETDRRNIKVNMKWDKGVSLPWTGYPGHLTQVLITLTRNTLAHAYKEGQSGRIDIAVVDERTRYRIEFRDYGAGIPDEIFRRLFEPFVTSAREAGAMGLGLAVAHNVVTNILGGHITCSSLPGTGTTVLLRIPHVCPRDEDAARPAMQAIGSITPARRAE